MARCRCGSAAIVSAAPTFCTARCSVRGSELGPPKPLTVAILCCLCGLPHATLPLPMVCQPGLRWFSTDGPPCCPCGLRRPPLPDPLLPHPTLDAPCSSSAAMRAISPSHKCKEGSCTQPTRRPVTVLPAFPIDGSHTHAWDTLPRGQRRSKGTAKQCTARTPGAPGLVVCLSLGSPFLPPRSVHIVRLVHVLPTGLVFVCYV